ncbi:N-acetyl-gamma-glutamyl-phosphate reductase [Denitrificimonas caeni]|uniref:N-acetyl-gamma-glutamyl-phosphate reductase n=1 Tax=Denitrificimonas caeni TaxID=521720 RepID=A0AAE9VQ78_9GAMM|nr:N-acetyl-gamma-glutamyl-phosphate reductase [Denitrificimonas caeni]NLJ12538.1 N-acetyl-gamma-glutamyl-phosphate reductase [Gammaproteobacteria bacterium]WBE25443.1 N-acetyl-gamma-glutamyl-phosphate reductase [Denitrificimonas caeni]
MIKVAIVGGTGYTGVELLRLLALHPHAQVEVITSRSEEGVRVADMYPNLRESYPELVFSVPQVDKLTACDVVFFATPHGVAHGLADEILQAGTRVIDLSADFRLEDAEEWSQWYGQPHGAPHLLADAVYGLPEVNREAIKTARLIAVPGCYPTAVQLALLPLVEAGLAETQQIIASCASGVSGAGRGAKIGSLFCEAAENMVAYGVSGHRHLPEIKQGLRRAAGQSVGLTFVPHLVPMIRGIHATLYATVLDRSLDLQSVYEQRYQNEPFVDVLPAGVCPQTRSVKGANMCRIAVQRPQDGDVVVVMAVIDNLVKGASGQAVQNMNIMFGLDESSGLNSAALIP